MVLADWDLWQTQSSVHHISLSLNITWKYRSLNRSQQLPSLVRRVSHFVNLFSMFVVIFQAGHFPLVLVDSGPLGPHITELLWEESLVCGHYTFTLPSYTSECVLRKLRSFTRTENISWVILSDKKDKKPLTLFRDAEVVFLETDNCLGIKFYNKQVYNFLIVLAVSCLTYFLNIILMRENNFSFLQILPLLISMVIPIFHQNLVDKGPFNIIMSFFGWNILLTILPIFYQVLSSKKARISPNPPQNNKFVQIDMYTTAKDEDEDKMCDTNKSRKAFLIFYVICILVSLLMLFAIFYNTVKDNILDLVRKSI